MIMTKLEKKATITKTTATTIIRTKDDDDDIDDNDRLGRAVFALMGKVLIFKQGLLS